MKEETPPISSRRVLFVDDDELVARTAGRDLADTGLELTVVASAEEALATMERAPFGVVLSDYHMPRIDGIELLEAVRERCPDASRVLVSGKADFATAIEVINRVGLFAFVTKPWDPLDLCDTVRRAMKHHELVVENRALNWQLSEKAGELESLNRSLELEVHTRTTNLLTGLVNALDLRDTETQTHSRRVALYSKRLAEKLGISGEDLLAVERGALLHDIGKIGVSDTILLKPGKLTEEEWAEMRKHSEHGYRILEGIEFLGEAREIVRAHHERWDGKGYPRGLAGSRICVGARIFAVIDTYDAMTSDRPYRKALPHIVANAEIEENKGSQFDPEVVDAWLSVPQTDILKLKEEAETPRSPGGGR